MTRVLVETGPDAGALWHAGDPFAEQRALLAGEARVDLDHRDLLRISGADRLYWLHSITSQALADLEPGRWVEGLVLDANGRLRWGFTGMDDGEAFTLHTEPGAGEEFASFLGRMIFMARVQIDVPDVPLSWGSGGYAFSPAGPREAGMWAFEALRIARGDIRVGLDTDERTIPNELGLWGTALGKGCYPGQETVARTHTLGRPPRRLVRLSLDGSEDRLPAVGADIVLDGKVVGRVGSSARHFEEGPIALGVVKRTVPVDVDLLADGIPASQEALVDPDVGEHVRPRL